MGGGGDAIIPVSSTNFYGSPQPLLPKNSLPLSTPGSGSTPSPVSNGLPCDPGQVPSSPGLSLPFRKTREEQSTLTFPNLSPFLLSGRVSFLVNPLANNVMKLLVPALPKLVKSQVSGIRTSLVCKDCSPCRVGVELQAGAEGPVSA